MQAQQPSKLDDRRRVIVPPGDRRRDRCSPRNPPAALTTNSAADCWPRLSPPAALTRRQHSDQTFGQNRTSPLATMARFICFDHLGARARIFPLAAKNPFSTDVPGPGETTRRLYTPRPCRCGPRPLPGATRWPPSPAINAASVSAADRFLLQHGQPRAAQRRGLATPAWRWLPRPRAVPRGTTLPACEELRLHRDPPTPADAES